MGVSISLISQYAAGSDLDTDFAASSSIRRLSGETLDAPVTQGRPEPRDPAGRLALPSLETRAHEKNVPRPRSKSCAGSFLA